MAGDTRGVGAHYGRDGIEQTIVDGLRAIGKDPERVTPEDLAPADQFHLGGLQATLDLLARSGLGSDDRVLDVGGGIGGAARTLASKAGCSVTVLDATPEFCDAGESLTNRAGLGEKVSFVHGDATAMPFDDGAFDAVWIQHANMNIADKKRLVGEIARVVRPGGRLALHEILAGPEQPPHYPVPWAGDPSISHLIAPVDLRTLLASVGFAELVWEDETASAIAFLHERLDSPPPPFGVHLLVGSRVREVFGNTLRSLEERRIEVAQGVLERG